MLGFRRFNYPWERLLILLILFICGCASRPYVVSAGGDQAGAKSRHVFVVSHGWHTGLVIPAGELQGRLPALKARFGKTPYLELGWGDKGFYQAKEITSGLTLRAIFWPTESVVHIVSVPTTPAGYFPHSEVAAVCLSEGGYSSLLSFIVNSFARDESGEIVELKNGIYGDSQFYAGVGDYYLMNTCNKWTAKALKSAGIAIDPMFKLTAGSVMEYVRQGGSSALAGRRPVGAAKCVETNMADRH
jgi:uncharacterized protein (TIGR02117 family)